MADGGRLPRQKGYFYTYWPSPLERCCGVHCVVAAWNVGKVVACYYLIVLSRGEAVKNLEVPTSDASADLSFPSSLPHFALWFFIPFSNVTPIYCS
jgi:hypothetical protein